MAEIIELTGKRFGYLVVLFQAAKPRSLSNTRAQWWCQCDCGNALRVEGASLRNGPTKSCGCQMVAMIAKAKTKHGHRTDGATREYESWCGMLARCLNPRLDSYRHYGGRGISVCFRWLDFRNFYADMGKRPADTSIGRIDNDGNYEPTNCRWETDKQQMNNTRANRILQWEGLTYTAKGLSEHLHIPYQWFYDRAVRQNKSISSIVLEFGRKSA